ncbi:unnamed protein product [Diamesa serratosioi]
MGGHGHHEAYSVPDAKIYKVADAPKLMEVQTALARQGLKDPWLRNEVWRYNVKAHGSHRSRVIGFLFRGLPLGIAAFAATIAAEKAFDIDFHGDHMTKHGGGDGHH